MEKEVTERKKKIVVRNSNAEGKIYVKTESKWGFACLI